MVTLQIQSQKFKTKTGLNDYILLPGVKFVTRKTGLDDKLDFKMVATINAAGSWRSSYDKDPAYAKRVHPDGSFAGRWSRPNRDGSCPFSARL